MPSEDNITPYSQIEAAIDDGDAAAARALITKYPEELKDSWNANYLIRLAARKSQLHMLALLVDNGVDVNIIDDDGNPEGPLNDAAQEGAVDAVRWLLDHGATIHHQVDGVTRCLPLSGAARQGHLDVVKLLIERGANVNASWKGRTPLTFALMYNQPAVAAYLRSKGAQEPS